MKGEWKRLHNEELSDLYLSPNTIRVMRSRRMRSVGHVALKWVFKTWDRAGTGLIWLRIGTGGGIF